MTHLPGRLVLLALLAVAGCASPPPPAAAPAAPPPPAPPPSFNELGRSDAPVTIVEFSDLQCRFCARHAEQTFPRLRSAYVETGKVRYVVRDLPLPYHAYAVPAAVAARCAGAQGRYFEYRDALFREQHRLAQEPYAELAGRLGLDLPRFEACRADPAQAEAVRADVNLAAALGLGSTPSFVIGPTVPGRPKGETVVGAKPYEVFEARIEALLAAPR